MIIKLGIIIVQFNVYVVVPMLWCYLVMLIKLVICIYISPGIGYCDKCAI